MLTYNHEKYISEAINGVLTQSVDFPIELVISNDCSIDKTDEIIKQLIKKHPNGHVIKYFSQNQNIGMHSNFLFALDKCKGKYIALCEGDDFWAYEKKLQIQVDFLENNSDYVMVGHNAKIIKGHLKSDQCVRNIKSEYVDYETRDFLERNPFVTLGTVYRNIQLSNFDEIVNNFTVCDRPLFTYLSHFGKCRFYYKTVGYYRIHNNSITYNNRKKYLPFKNDLKNRIKCATFWNEYNNLKYEQEAARVIKKRSRQLVNIAVRNYDFKTAILYSKYLDIKDLNNLSSKITLFILRLLGRN